MNQNIKENLEYKKLLAKLCRYPSCNNLVPKGESYCYKHKREKQASQSVPFETAVRYNQGLYNTTLFKNIRKKLLQENPHCFRCGIGKEANLQIHHIIAPLGNEDLFYDESNCVVVCEQCHRVITAKEISDRKGRVT